MRVCLDGQFCLRPIVPTTSEDGYVHMTEGDKRLSHPLAVVARRGGTVDHHGLLPVGSEDVLQLGVRLLKIIARQ